MIAHYIIVSFYIFRFLKYDRIFGKNLEHDTYMGKSVPGLVPKICVLDRIFGKNLEDDTYRGKWVPGLVPKICVLFLWHI